MQLPISAFRDKISDTIRSHPVVIIAAETGSGKSTQVPQYLLDLDYKIVVTQPRRIAARTIAERVASERGEELGGIVGYQTAIDGQRSEKTRCLYVTDGLALVRELVGEGDHQVLIIDEVHEWNKNIEVLVAWTRRKLQDGWPLKVVLMSASADDERLAEFYGGAPIIRVPGRTFPITEKGPGENIVRDVVELVRKGDNVLVFQPGKREIEETIEELRFLVPGAEVLPLHGDLTPAEQAICFASYPRPKVIVSTNVAQTSVTIPDIDSVVDSGIERRIELVDGIEGLYLGSISAACREQRKGRAGRTKPGTYIDHCEDRNRPDFAKAEILRSRLDQVVLRLAEMGIDMEDLEFFHQPSRAEIKRTKKRLERLGCTLRGKVTETGHAVARMPVSAQAALMVLEAAKRGVVDEVIIIAAIFESGEIQSRETNDWKRLIHEKESDPLAQLSLFRQAEKMTEDERKVKGIHEKTFLRARDIREHLTSALRGMVVLGSSGKRKEIMKCITAGLLDHIYSNHRGVLHGEDEREMSRDSCASGKLLVGLPFDLEVETRYGNRVINLLRMVTAISDEWIAELAPDRTIVKRGKSKYYPRLDSFAYQRSVYFDGNLISEDWIPDEDRPRRKKTKKPKRRR